MHEYTNYFLSIYLRQCNIKKVAAKLALNDINKITDSTIRAIVFNELTEIAK